MDEKVIAYWTEPIQIGAKAYDITVASTTIGLCWLSLGTKEKQEELHIWSRKWLQEYFSERKYEANRQVLQELKEYFLGQRREFTVSLHQVGTPFQVRVWQELLRIPYANTRSYGEVAEKLDNPKGSRAVGLANSKNPIPVIVPCHRVIGKDGGLTGYAGGLELKQELLRLEQER